MCCCEPAAPWVRKIHTYHLGICHSDQHFALWNASGCPCSLFHKCMRVWVAVRWEKGWKTRCTFPTACSADWKFCHYVILSLPLSHYSYRCSGPPVFLFQIPARSLAYSQHCVRCACLVSVEYSLFCLWFLPSLFSRQYALPIELKTSWISFLKTFPFPSLPIRRCSGPPGSLFQIPARSLAYSQHCVRCAYLVSVVSNKYSVYCLWFLASLFSRQYHSL